MRMEHPSAFSCVGLLCNHRLDLRLLLCVRPAALRGPHRLLLDNVRLRRAVRVEDARVARCSCLFLNHGVHLRLLLRVQRTALALLACPHWLLALGLRRRGLVRVEDALRL